MRLRLDSRRNILSNNMRNFEKNIGGSSYLKRKENIVRDNNIIIGSGQLL